MDIAVQLGELLQARQQTLTTAESCTGGLIAGAITDVAGSSAWFERGYVVYSNPAKQDMLAVPAEVIITHGAVSEPVVRALASNARDAAKADWAIAVSGIAGPGGGSAEKPVGLVWFAWAGAPGVVAESCQFSGDRQAVRAQAVAHGILRLIQLIRDEA